MWGILLSSFLFFSLAANAGEISVGKVYGSLPAFGEPEKVSSLKTEILAGEPHLVVYGSSKSFPRCYISFELLRKNGIDRIAFARTLAENNPVVIQCSADAGSFASDIFVESR